MNAQRIVEFNSQGMGTFIKFLQFLAKKMGWGWEFEVHPEFSMDVLKTASAAKVDPSLSEQILPFLSVLPTQVRGLQCLDSFFKEDGSWYPRLIFHEALRMVFVEYARDLDIRAPAFVIGDGEKSRAVASVLAEMGVREIYLVGDMDRLVAQKEILSRSQVGIHFYCLPVEDLTLQAVSAGVVVNTVDLSDSKSLLVDLSYFNYMKRSGFALDLNVLPRHNTLLEEAERAELRVLSPLLVEVTQTILWLERLNLKGQIQKAEIESLWGEFLNSASV